jgi:hypothetical protein
LPGRQGLAGVFCVDCHDHDFLFCSKASDFQFDTAGSETEDSRWRRVA